MGEQPRYVWDPWCRKHILRTAYTAHAAAHHPKTPAVQGTATSAMTPAPPDATEPE